MSFEPELLLETSRFRVIRKRRTLGDGSQFEREIIEHPGAAVILPLVTPDQVCLIRNYRISVDTELIELPAGTIAPPEDPLTTADRELIEETGYRAGKLVKIHEFLVSPGILNERMHLFLATDLSLGDTAREHGEQIQNLVVPLDEALAMVDKQQIRDAKTIVGLLYYERMRK